MKIVGLQKESWGFRLAYLSMINGKVVIECLKKETNITCLKKDLLIVTGIEGQNLLIRHLKSPLKNIHAFRKTLPFQLETLIPYSLKDAIIKPIHHFKEKETHALFFTISKKTLLKHITGFQKEGIDPEWVSANPMALFRFASFIAPNEKSLVVFYVGMKKIQLVSIRENKILNHIILHIGSQDLNNGDHATVVGKLKREVDRAFCFLAHKEQTKGSRNVLFCGERTKEVDDLLKGKREYFINPVEIQGYRDFNGETLRSYAMSIGLAIDALKNDTFSIQFRQESFVSEKSFSSLKKGILQGGTLAGILLIVTFLSFQVFYYKKEKILTNYVDQFITYYKKDIPGLEGDLKEKSLDERLSDLNQRLRLPKSKELIFSNPPLVSDLLGFISSHPKFEGVEIKRLDYELKGYPSFRRPKDLYRPKVHLVFLSKEEKKARAFHDAIIDDEILVDKDREIEWKRNEDEYEITFFLQT